VSKIFLRNYCFSKNYVKSFAELHICVSLKQPDKTANIVMGGGGGGGGGVAHPIQVLSFEYGGVEIFILNFSKYRVLLHALHVNSSYAHHCFFTKRRLGTRQLHARATRCSRSILILESIKVLTIRSKRNRIQVQIF
jgi:hypothetical protein